MKFYPAEKILKSIEMKSRFTIYLFDENGANPEKLPNGICFSLGTTIMYFDYYYIVTEVDYNTKSIYATRTIKH